MTSETNNSKDKPIDNIKNNPDGELNNENSNNNIILTITQPETKNIIQSDEKNKDIQLQEKNNKVTLSNTSLNSNNFEDELEENKIVYEINFPPSEEEIKPRANKIKTTKYNIFTFLPLNLWSQFHRFSNIYFLLGALSTFFGYSVVSPIAQVMPLIIVLSVTAIKDAYGDIKRSADDKKANKEPYYILRNNEVKQVLCQDIYPGDIIVIQKGDKIPADCLLLSSSNDDGICYVETSDLDGETSLKKKTSLSELSCIRDLEGYSRIQGKIQCEPPCDSFSSFEGRIYFETVFKPRQKDAYSVNTSRTNLSTISREIKKNLSNVSNMIRGNSSFVKVGSSMPDSSLSLNINQMLFRGSVLRNTDCVYLMAIYTGRETRVFRNSKQVGLKMSTLEPQLNRYLIYIFIFNFAVLFISVILQLFDSYKIIKRKRNFDHWYIHTNSKWNTLTEILRSILSFFALYTYFVPLSLFVTLEVVRIIQSWYFQWDHAMMGQREVESDTKPTNDTILNLDNDPNLISSRVNSANAANKNGRHSHELVKSQSSKHILPKLEALRKEQEQEQEQNQEQNQQNQNQSNTKSKQWVPMKVNSLNVGEDLGAIQYIFSDKTGTLTKNMMILSKWCIDGKIFDASNEPSCLHQEVNNLYKTDNINSSINREEFKDKILEYCRALATCHEVMISFDPKSYKPVYESQSPDETAIVIGLEKAGIRLVSRTKDNIVFQLWNNEESHEILLLTEFTSDRKCMTVIVKRETDKGPVYTLYTKGADDIISRRLSANKAVNNEAVLTDTMNALKLFGKMGYRVLMVAEKIIDKETFECFINMYRKAECSLGNRTKNITKALEYIEKDLILLGLTAVEDQLQDNIPETIDYLLNAGIKMWLLTGDQQDTAINIGLSSCLLNNNSNLMILNDRTYRKCERTLEKYINEMKDNDEWGYPMLAYNKKDENEDDSIMYDEKHDKNFNNSKISYKWEKNVLVVNGDALAAIFGKRPEKKDKPHHNHIHHSHNRLNSSKNALYKDNKKITKSHSCIHKKPPLKKNDNFKIYPENYNPNKNDNDKYNYEQVKIIHDTDDNTNNIDKNNNIGNTSNTINNNNTDNVNNADKAGNAGNTNNYLEVKNNNNNGNYSRGSSITILNINQIILLSIDNIRNALMKIRKNQRKRERERDKKKKEEEDKKKNNEPYNPKDLTPLQRKFVEVGIRCRTVICCRVTPIQKANVVKAIRHNLKAVTLAIGDGANDVAMIQAAHVGVGIMGREGAQAVRASDYAFLEFRFLKPLLCVHGRYTYLQITKLILYSFYKNIVLSLVLFSYGFVSLWSGNTLLDNHFLLSFNLFYTCFVIPVLACYERDVGIQAIYDNPELYKQVKDGIYWNFAKRFGWILSSVWHGFVIVFVMIFLFNDNILRQDGSSSVSFWAQCYIIEIILILTVTIKCISIHERFTILSLIVSILSLSIFFVFILIIDYLFLSLEASISVISDMPNCFLIILFSVVTSLLPDYVVYFVKSTYYPSDAQIIFQERKINKSKTKYNKMEAPYNSNCNINNQPLLSIIEKNNENEVTSKYDGNNNSFIKNDNNNNDKNNNTDYHISNKDDTSNNNNNNINNNNIDNNSKENSNNLDENNDDNFGRPVSRPMISKKLSEILIEKNENNIEFPLRSKNIILNQNSLLYQKSFMSESEINLIDTIENIKDDDKSSFFSIRNSSNYIHTSENNTIDYENKQEEENNNENENNDHEKNNKEVTENDQNDSNTKKKQKKKDDDEINNDSITNKGSIQHSNDTNDYSRTNTNLSNTTTSTSSTSTSSSTSSSERSNDDISDINFINEKYINSNDKIINYNNNSSNNENDENLSDSKDEICLINVSNNGTEFISNRSSEDSIYLNLPSGEKKKLPSIKNRKLQYSNNKIF